MNDRGLKKWTAKQERSAVWKLYRLKKTPQEIARVTSMDIKRVQTLIRGIEHSIREGRV